MEEEVHRKSRENRTTKIGVSSVEVCGIYVDAQSDRVNRYGVKTHPTLLFLNIVSTLSQAVLYIVKNL